MMSDAQPEAYKYANLPFENLKLTKLKKGAAVEHSRACFCYMFLFFISSTCVFNICFIKIKENVTPSSSLKISFKNILLLPL